MFRRTRLLSVLALAPVALGVAACDDDEGAPRTELEPLYVFSSLVFSPSSDAGSTTYLVPLNAIAARENVTLADAVERPGYSPANAVGGALFVGSGDGPTVTRLHIYDDGRSSEDGSIGFNNYTTTSLEASAFVSDTVAYQPYDITSHAVWNPSTLTISGTIASPEAIPTSLGGLPVRRGYARETSGHFYYQPYYYASDDYHSYTETSKILVIDTDTNQVVNVVDAPCPHLHITSKDAAGNVYFSNGQGSIASAVLDAEQPRNCVARILAGQTTLDAAFTRTFASLADGREGSNVFVIGPNTALFNVYHAERDAITEDTPFTAIDYSANYHLWKLDLTTMEAEILDGADYAGGQVVVFTIDGRTILTVPAANYSTTAVFEVSTTGTITKLFDVEGWAFNLFRVR